MDSTLTFAWTQLKPHGRAVVSAVCWRTLFRLLPVQLPLLTGALIDGLSGRPASLWGWALPGGQPQTVVYYAGLAMTAVAIATGIAAYGSGRATSSLSRRTIRHLRRRVMEAWEHASSAFHSRYGASKLFDRTMSETRSIGRFARDTVVEGTAAGVRLLYPAAMLVWIDPWMAAIPLSAIPAQALLTAVLQQRQGSLGSEIREGKSRITCRVKENLDSIETVQAMCAQREFMRRIEADAEELDAEQDSYGAASSMITGAVWGLAAMAVAGSWWVGGARVAGGEISAGQLVAFTGFVGFLAVPLRRLGRLAKSTRSALSRLRRIEQMLAAAEADACRGGARKIAEMDAALTLDRVCYAHRNLPVLQDASMEIPAGEFVWIRGRSGAGKSTLLRLLARFDVPASGTIRLGGQDLRECDVDSVRRAISFVPQHPAIFSGTVAENLRMGAPEATLFEVLEACVAAGLGDTISALDNGLETLLGEGGAKLSGGEAQRLAIARALLRRPRVLLLDEPTAALDPDSEERLLRHLAALTPAITVIMVAHSVRSLSGIHRMVELSDGRLRDWCTEAIEAQSQCANVA